jgi:hypothetical protein
MTNKEVVKHLQEGWYGYKDAFDDVENRNPNVPIYVLAMPKKFIPLCEGLSGTMENLVIDRNHKKVMDGIPVDLLMLELVQGLAQADMGTKNGRHNRKSGSSHCGECVENSRFVENAMLLTLFLKIHI